MSLQMLVILVPVVFGLMGFAVDLGRLYMIRGELNQVTTAMALAAAGQLNGTAAALDNATAAAQTSLDDTTGNSNKYNFGSIQLGTDNGLLSSQLGEPAYFATAAAATGADTTGSDQADGTTARHVQMSVTADAPLLFWGFLSLGQARKTTIAARAVAGISAPLCTVCSTMPIAILPVDAAETVDFGYVANTSYTFYFGCNNPPAALSGSNRYGIIDRDKVSTADASQNLYRIGAAGMISSSTRTQSCLSVNDNTVTTWLDPDTSAYLLPAACTNLQPPTAVINLMCGLNTRFDTAVPDVCSNNVTEVDSLAAVYTPDTDVTLYDDYTQYIGNQRRIITVAVVDVLPNDTAGTSTILGFRQFLLNPNADGLIPVTDQWGRFDALYIGSIVPVPQGYIGDTFQLGCSITSGPGKVVLHQ
jgi:Flp pilus assembly protein TadG